MLQATGFHQPKEWHGSRFRGAVQATVSTARLRRLGSESSLSRADLSEAESDAEQREHLHKKQEGKEAAKKRLARSHLEEASAVACVLRAIDPSLLEPGPGSVNELSRRGIAFVTVCSTLGFHLLRLLLRDVLFDALLSRAGRDARSVAAKRRLTEVYLLSCLHALGCGAFSLCKLSRGRWDSPGGSEPMLCFSLGYTGYSLLTLRKQLFSDPMFALNELANFVKIVSCLRSRGVGWIVPLLMSAEMPLACLNILRMMAEMGVARSSLSWRLMLGAFAASFAAIKGVLLPGGIFHFVVRRAKEYPELHQPSFLPAKLALLLRAALNYTWLGVVARHWIPSRRPPSHKTEPRTHLSERLPQLSDLTSDMDTAWQAARSALNPLGLLYFIGMQSAYVVVPAALPAMLYAMVRRPRLRLAAGSGIAALGLLTVWPMKVDTPFNTKPLTSREMGVVGKLGRVVRSYFSFQSIFEEPLQKDRRYLVAVLPHGVMPFAMNCLHSELVEKGLVPNFVGASVLLKVPILRQLVRAAGVIPASTKVIQKALRWPHPNNVTFIVPGGIAEMFYMRPDLEQVFVKGRKGFVKLALQAGADLVPVYGLGHTHLFSTFDKSSRLGGFLMRLSRRLQISLPLTFGRWGMPLVPHARPVAALVGRPIRVERAVAEPSAELVDEVHGQFVAELRRVFDKHKHLVPGYENKRLYFEDEEVPPLPGDAVTTDNLFPSSLPALSSRL